jgi:hypothetical protein
MTGKEDHREVGDPIRWKWGVMPMDQDERDIVEFTDEEGNTLLLEVMDYFFYKGEEFAVLCDADEEDCDHCHDADCTVDCEDDTDESSVNIMKVQTVTGEDGEEMEEFVSPDESMLEQLIEVVQARFSEEDDDDISDDDEEEDPDEENKEPGDGDH